MQTANSPDAQASVTNLNPMSRAELVLVNLSNGDTAIFINAKAVYCLERSEAAGVRQMHQARKVAENISDALGIDLQIVDMDEPKDSDWNWDDVYELLPPSNAEVKPDTMKVVHWNAAHYGGEVDSCAEYTMRVSDQRESNGQMFIDIEPIEGHMDDNGLGVTLEVNNPPGADNSHVPCAHITFGSGNLAFSVFQQGLDKLLLRPETGVRISGGFLPNREHAFCVEEG